MTERARSALSSVLFAVVSIRSLSILPTLLTTLSASIPIATQCIHAICSDSAVAEGLRRCTTYCSHSTSLMNNTPACRPLSNGSSRGLIAAMATLLAIELSCSLPQAMPYMVDQMEIYRFCPGYVALATAHHDLPYPVEVNLGTSFHLSVAYCCEMCCSG